MTADQLLPGGLDHAAMKEIAARLAASRKLDYLGISGSTGETAELQAKTVPSLDHPLGLFNHYAASIKEVVDLPVLVAARIIDPAMAEEVLRRGAADLIGMTRALIADPDLPAKARAGRREDIRLCTGANEGCIGRLYQGLAIRCVQNPLIGHEAELDAVRPAAAPRRVAVVGGGPAGMEAARMAAERGHRVTLLERGDALGGQVRLAARAPHRAEYGRSVDWLARALGRLPVELRLGTEATVDALLAEAPDAVVVATGAAPRPAPWPGADRPHVVTAEAVLAGDAAMGRGRRCVVVDDDGHMRGPGAAEAILDAGGRVEIVTREAMVGVDVDPTLRPMLYRRLFEKGAVLTPHTAVQAVGPDAVRVEHVYSRQAREIPADLVVLALGGEARAELYHALRAAAPGLEVHRVGDAVAPRRLYDAILEGTRAGRLV
jgi:NADPH-dependent 2,4-dienoyl-CoA reductase/sulfur reductase-like enzyme